MERSSRQFSLTKYLLHPTSGQGANDRRKQIFVPGAAFLKPSSSEQSRNSKCTDEKTESARSHTPQSGAPAALHSSISLAWVKPSIMLRRLTHARETLIHWFQCRFSER